MPELPEVETTRRGLLPHVTGQRIIGLTVRNPRLRWPVQADLGDVVRGQRIATIDRRAKYLLFRTRAGSLMLHLGMSGSVRVLTPPLPAPAIHDHVDIRLGSGCCLRYNDPRRFGSLHWITAGSGHALLDRLGPEPFDDRFSGAYLHRLSRGRRASVKSFLMDGRVVVGVGNIYASEALFLAGIRPDRAAGRVGPARYERLAGAVRQVLRAAIEAGGTTLRDFLNSDGSPGYFAVQLRVYGRGGLPCPGCGGAVRQTVIGQRATYYCVVCQR